MDLLIVLTYVALAWAVFKIFRIPVNQWTLATAALGGVFLVSGLILLMNYNHPYTFTAQKAVIAIPIAKWHLNRSQFGIRIDHDLASISDHSLASQSITIWHASDH